MKGYKPKLIKNNSTEINSKTQSTFLELGIKNHEEQCDCEKCKDK